jgi:hypothetical protein
VTTPAPRQATASWPVISPRGLGVGVTHLVHLAGSYRRWRARNTAAGGVVTGCSGTSWFCYIGPAALRPGRTAGGPRRCCWRCSWRSGWRPEGLAAQTPADPLGGSRAEVVEGALALVPRALFVQAQHLAGAGMGSPVNVQWKDSSPCTGGAKPACFAPVWMGSPRCPCGRSERLCRQPRLCRHPRPGGRQPNPLRVQIHRVKTHLRSWLQILPSLRRRWQC